MQKEKSLKRVERARDDLTAKIGTTAGVVVSFFRHKMPLQGSNGKPFNLVFVSFQSPQNVESNF